MKLRLTQRAYNDIVDIDQYIAKEQQRPLAAKAVLDKIHNALKRIQDMPHIGRKSYQSV